MTAVTLWGAAVAINNHHTGFEPVLDPDFDGPLSERELDALDATFRPIGLVAAAIVGGRRMSAAVERYLEWRDLWNDRRAITYYEGDIYDALIDSD